MRIEELEKENAVLKGRNEGFEQQIMGLLIKYEEVYKRFPDLKSAMDKAQTILKENAELKDYRLNTMAKEQTEMSKYALNLEHKLGWYDTQLTKAKELLNEFMRISKASDEDFEHDYSELIGETEQFIKEIEK